MPSDTVPGLAIVVDTLAITLAAALPYVILDRFSPETIEHYVFCWAFVLGATILLLRHSRMYDIDAVMRPLARSDMILVSVVSAFLFFLTIAFSLKVSDIYSRLWIYSFLGGAIVLTTGGRLLLAAGLGQLMRRRIMGRSLVVLGTGEPARRFLKRLERARPWFTDVQGVFATEEEGAPAEIEGYPRLGRSAELGAFVRANRIDDVVIALDWSHDARLAAEVERLKELPCDVHLAIDLPGYHLEFRPVVGQLAELPLFAVVSRPMSSWGYLLKRIEDYVLATLFLVLLAPLMLLVAVAIKIDSRGPVFFLQKRIGFNNEVFHIWKFRSMYHVDDPERHFRQARRNDPRITRVGRIIRRSSIDELPQLFNVLNGSMSLVGPRPHALRHNEEYGREIRGYFARHKVRPGITGWAQVNGLRGETETLSKMEARVAHDVYYAENWSLLFDLRILVMTLVIVLFQRTAY